MMPYCQLCEKASPCKHWPTEDVELRSRDYGLDAQIDNAIREKMTEQTDAALPVLGTLVVDGTEYPAPETVVLNGYLYRRDDSASVL